MSIKRCRLAPSVLSSFQFLSDVSQETDKEMGMLICQKGNKYASGGICIGETCSVHIPNKCPTGYAPVIQAHTHPGTVDLPSSEDFMSIAADRVPEMCVISPGRTAFTCFENASEFMERQKKKQLKEYSSKTFVKEWRGALNTFSGNPNYDIDRMHDLTKKYEFADELALSREVLYGDGMELLLEIAKEFDKEGLKFCLGELGP
jgi:hypothetical protein